MSVIVNIAPLREADLMSRIISKIVTEKIYPLRVKNLN